MSLSTITRSTLQPLAAAAVIAAGLLGAAATTPAEAHTFVPAPVAANPAYTEVWGHPAWRYGYRHRRFAYSHRGYAFNHRGYLFRHRPR